MSVAAALVAWYGIDSWVRALKEPKDIEGRAHPGALQAPLCFKQGASERPLACTHAPSKRIRSFAGRKRIAKLQAASSPTTAPPVEKFDLALAVSLAGAAFEAYLLPTGAEGLQQKALNGSEITFTDREFLSEAYQGVVLVELQKATNLRAADPFGTSDPYAVLTLADGSAKSKVIDRTVNPEWNETFCMYVRDVEKDILKVRLYDKDFMKSDDDLGLTMMPLSSLTSGSSQNVELELKGPGSQPGNKVHLKLTLLRFADAELPELLNVMTADGAEMPTLDPPQPAVSGPDMLQEIVQASQTDGKIDDSSSSGPLPFVPNLAKLQDQVAKNLQEFQKAMPIQLQGSATASNDVASAQAEVTNAWKVLAKMADRAVDGAAVPVAYIDNVETDTQVWIYRNIAAKEVVVAFRGTEQIKWKDLATDLNLTPTSLNPERVDNNSGLPFTLRVLKSVMPTEEMMVHKGFLDAYDSVRQQVLPLVDQITGSGDKGHWKVFVTGHSLGGALATLCAFELAARQSKSRKAQDIVLYTYGAPRVGNKAFAQQYDRLVPDSWRITNKNDIIPSVPRLMGYCHVGHAVRLSSSGKLKVAAETTDIFGEGKGGAEVIQELATKVIEQDKSLDQIYDQILSAEMAILEKLMDGRALEEHMETFYLDTLKQCVLASTGQKLVEAVEAEVAKQSDAAS